jgi:hypothetical protein
MQLRYRNIALPVTLMLLQCAGPDREIRISKQPVYFVASACSSVENAVNFFYYPSRHTVITVAALSCVPFDGD